MLAHMPARTFNEWMCYYSLEPFGEERADVRNGMLCTLVGNIFRKRGQRGLRPQDFVLGDKEPERQSGKEMEAIAKQFMMVHNAVIEQRKG